MTDEQNEVLNILTFDFSPKPHRLVSQFDCVIPVIDGKNFLDEWNLGGSFIPLPYYALIEPILSLDNFYTQCDTISIERFCLFSCNCGYTDCDAVVCDIVLDEYGEMHWKNFGTKTGGALGNIGPFRFDWDQTLEALLSARDHLRTTLSPKI